MKRLRAAGRIVTIGLCRSMSLDTLGQREAVEQKKLSEFLHLTGLLWCEGFLFLVSRFIAFVTQKVSPICHRRSKQLLCGQRFDAGFESLLFEVIALWANRGGGSLQDLAEHHAGASGVSAPQVIHRLPVVPRHRRGDVLGCADLHRLRMHGNLRKAFVARVTGTFSWGVCRSTVVHEFDYHTFSAFAAHKKRIPDWIALFSMCELTAELEPYSLGRAVGAV